MKKFIAKVRYWTIAIVLAITTFITSAFAQVQMNHPTQCFPKENSMQVLKKNYSKIIEISGEGNLLYQVWGDGKTKETLIFLLPKVAGGAIPIAGGVWDCFLGKVYSLINFLIPVLIPIALLLVILIGAIL